MADETSPSAHKEPTDTTDAQRDDLDDDLLFEEVGGLATVADLGSMGCGQSPVRARVDGPEYVRLTVGLAGGEASALLRPNRARQLGEALIAGAAEIEDAEARREAEADA